jgi:hypothetical protein
MATTYQLIEAKTLSSAVAYIEFTSIPQTYTDLQIVLSTRHSESATQATIFLYSINGVTNAFTDKVLRGDGASASSFIPSEVPLYIGQSPAANATASVFASHSVYIPNYTSSNNKVLSVESVQETNSTTAYLSFTGGLWANTSAITSMSFTPNSLNFVQYSTATLYGIKNT